MMQHLRVGHAQRGAVTLAAVLLMLTAISMSMTLAEIQRGDRGAVNADAMAKALEATPALWSAKIERAYAEKSITAYQREAMLQQLTDVIPVFKESARSVRNAGIGYMHAR